MARGEEQTVLSSRGKDLLREVNNSLWIWQTTVTFRGVIEQMGEQRRETGKRTTAPISVH